MATLRYEVTCNKCKAKYAAYKEPGVFDSKCPNCGSVNKCKFTPYGNAEVLTCSMQGGASTVCSTHHLPLDSKGIRNVGMVTAGINNNKLVVVSKNKLYILENEKAPYYAETVLDKSTVEAYEDYGEASRFDTKKLLKLTFWFGTTGLLAGTNLAKISYRSFAIKYKDGRKSVITINPEGQNIFNSVRLNIRNGL